mgnify:CR=1 FL=1
MDHLDTAHFDVAIVGYGPAGATLAHLLSLFGRYGTCKCIHDEPYVE